MTAATQSMDKQAQTMDVIDVDVNRWSYLFKLVKWQLDWSRTLSLYDNIDMWSLGAKVVSLVILGLGD